MTQREHSPTLSQENPMQGLSEDTLRAIRNAVRDSAVPEPKAAATSSVARGDEVKPDTQLRSRRKPKPHRAPRLQGGGAFQRLMSVTMSRLPSAADVKKAMTPRRLAVAVIIICIVIQPWFLPTVFFVFAFFVAFLCLALGPDRCRDIARWGWARFSKRRPEKAEAIRLRFNARREGVQKHLDRLPERWVSGLHLPHWQSDERAQAAESAFAQRMTHLAHDAQYKA